MSYYPHTSITTGVVVVAFVVLCLYMFRERVPVPPGPKQYPIIGNLLQMPKEREWLVYSKWSQSYGDCIFLRVLGQPLMILNSYNAASDLLDVRSAIYSSRPRLVMAGELTGFNTSLPLIPYSKHFRQMRQLLKKELVGSSLKKYWQLHEQESHALFRNLIDNPDGQFDSIRHYAGSVILKVTYGYQTAQNHDPLLLLAQRVMTGFSEIAKPGPWLVDAIPWLRHIPEWIPGAAFKRKAAELNRLFIQLGEGPYIWAKKHQDSPFLIRPNFTNTILTEKADSFTDEQEGILRLTSVSLFAGGSDTTVCALSSFFLAMALHPEVQRRGQDEIDCVLGGKRLPSLTDYGSLPYVQNIMRELLRWNPVAPLGVPHLLIEDDQYKGYHIPKGTIIIANIWSMLHNPEIFPDPEQFNPDRFLDNQRAVKEVGVAFGFGRRACPGVHFAEAAIFMAIATSLSTCTITNAVDENGHPIAKNVQYKTGLVSYPPYFKCTINPRSQLAVDLLNQEVLE